MDPGWRRHIELRGEIALQLTLAEATLADPAADTAAPAGDGRERRGACAGANDRRSTPGRLPATQLSVSEPNAIGLGLAIVQPIANAHRATVMAQARTGGGLRIAIVFPARMSRGVARRLV